MGRVRDKVLERKERFLVSEATAAAAAAVAAVSRPVVPSPDFVVIAWFGA